MLSREEEEDREPEITLSTSSLLGLFLGLVLVCGVFFGFGYSAGRRATANAESAASSTANDSGAVENDNSLRSADAVSSKDALTPKPTAATSSTVTLPVVETLEPVQKPVERSEAQAAEAAPGQAATASSSPTEAFQAMVQVAAVIHQEDAGVLVSALRKRGYRAVVRGGEPQDKLLHVQVGPFATRAEADAMKQKLAADGYDAIVKQ